MVIQCSECQTRFKLADDKMQPEGIKVRCAKCKHVFSVRPPAPAAEIAAPTPRPSVPDDTSFSGLLDEESGEDFSLGRQSEPDESASSPREETFSWGEEEAKPSWDDFAIEESAAADTATATDDTTPPEDFALGIAPAGPAEAEYEQFSSATPVGEPTAVDGAEDFGFETDSASPAEDFDFGLEDEPAAASEPSAIGTEPTDGQPALSPEEADFAFGADDSGFDDLLGEKAAAEPADDFQFAASPAEPAEAKAFAFGDDADTLDFADLDAASQKASASWDDLETDPFGDDFDLEQTSQTDKAFDFPELGFQEEAQVDQLGEEDFGDISLQNAPEPEPARLAPAVATPSDPAETGERSARSIPPPPAPVTAQRSPLRRLVLFVLGLLLALCGAAGYVLWQSGGLAPLIERMTGTTQAPVVPPQVRLTGLNGYFVTNKDAGQLFVIQGQAINDFPETRSAITVKGALYDKGGKLLVQQTVFCGNRLDDTALQELPFAKISEAMNNQFGDTLSNLNVARGKSIPFTIVFRNFPPELAEFTVESVDSRPGSN